MQELANNLKKPIESLPAARIANGPALMEAVSSQKPSSNSKIGVFGDIHWNNPERADNLPKDTKAKLRERAERIVNSELFSVMPKVLSVFGVWFTLTPMMKIWEKGLADTVKSVVPPALIAVLALGFDYKVKPWLKNFIEIPTPTPEVNLEKDLCWDKDDLQNFKRTLKSFMGSKSNYLRNKAAKNDLHGTNRDGLLILAGPPGNGKSAIAYGIGNLAAKPIYSLKVSETSSSAAIEAGFKEASRKGAILFIDEADAIIRSRGERVTQAFLETFNRYQRENPVRVILATNSFAEMDSAIQSRAYVFNLSNPSQDLKLDIFKKKIQDQGLKLHAYKKLLEEENVALKQLLSKHDLAGRDIESIIKDSIIISEMRIDQKLLASNKDCDDSSNVLDSNDNRIKLEDIELAIKEFMQNQEKAIKTSI